MLRRLMQALVETSGAERALYLSIGEVLTVEAQVAAAGHERPTDEPARDLPASLIDHVRRTRRTIVLDDPGAMAREPYFADRRPRSVVCLPVAPRGELVAIVYLEHESACMGIGPEQLAALELLAAQAGRLVELGDVHTELLRTERRRCRLEAELQSSRARLQAILDNMVDAVFVCDATGRMTLVNESAIRLLGLGSREAILRPVDELATIMRARRPGGGPFATDDLPLVRALRGEILSSIDMTLTNPRDQRDVHLRVNAAPIQNEAGAIVGAVAAASNVTEMVELDRMKEEFLRVAAHELKTPVAVVRGYADALRRVAKDAAPDQRGMLEALVRGADRIDRITTDLVLLMQLRAGRVELVVEPNIDLRELAEIVARRLEPAPASRRIEVVASRPVLVQGDRQLLEQVLSNLMSNALRYSPGGGPVEVELDFEPGTAVVSVTDRGVGIARERQQRMFEPFYRAHTDTEHDLGGMGAGLYLAKAIIARHGGTIGFTSEEGRGSTFTFRLPLQRG